MSTPYTQLRRCMNAANDAIITIQMYAFPRTPLTDTQRATLSKLQYAYTQMVRIMPTDLPVFTHTPADDMAIDARTYADIVQMMQFTRDAVNTARDTMHTRRDYNTDYTISADIISDAYMQIAAMARRYNRA